jgi:hypothetical protein
MGGGYDAKVCRNTQTSTLGFFFYSHIPYPGRATGQLLQVERTH